jgi:hypothetical protein
MGCFLTYCALTSSLSPLEGELGRFSSKTIAQVQGKDVWIPCDYRAKDEEYRLLLPGAKLHGYLAKDAEDMSSLTSGYPLVAVHVPGSKELAVCDGCQIVGKRMEMRARHSDEEIKEMLQGKVSQYLFTTEYLIATPTMNSQQLNMKDACR